MKAVLTLLAVVMTSSMILAFSGGPPDGKTGAPGEGLCTDCHGSFPVNSGDGMLTIDAPEVFQPGMTYAITVSLRDDGQSRWGFELTPLDQGTITITDADHTQLSMSDGNSYVKHTSTGTFNGTNDGPVSWTFDWTAPSIDVPEMVTLYAAGNAANANFGPTGDYIYTAMATINQTTGIDDYDSNVLPNILTLKSYPNPFNAVTSINYNVPSDGRVSLNIYDIQGRLINELAKGFSSAGSYTASWNGRDDRGNNVVSGVYFVRLMIDSYSTTNKLVLLK